MVLRTLGAPLPWAQRHDLVVARPEMQANNDVSCCGDLRSQPASWGNITRASMAARPFNMSLLSARNLRTTHSRMVSLETPT